MSAPYHPPVKRSLAVAGHATSISLEPLFWDQLKIAAQEEGIALSTLVALIDAERITCATPPGLAGAVRLWLVHRILCAQFHGESASAIGAELGSGEA